MAKQLKLYKVVPISAEMRTATSSHFVINHSKDSAEDTIIDILLDHEAIERESDMEFKVQEIKLSPEKLKEVIDSQEYLGEDVQVSKY